MDNFLSHDAASVALGLERVRRVTASVFADIPTPAAKATSFCAGAIAKGNGRHLQGLPGITGKRENKQRPNRKSWVWSSLVALSWQDTSPAPDAGGKALLQMVP